MANTGFFTGFIKNRLGPFKLIRRYTSPDLESGTDLGRIYEAYHPPVSVSNRPDCPSGTSVPA